MTLVKFNNHNARNVDPWIDGIFNSIFNDYSALTKPHAPFSKNKPLVNISEDKEGFGIEIAAPGFKKEDFKINLEELLLTISLEKKEEKKEEGKRYNKREFRYESFSRSFNLPAGIDGDNISAEYIDGILTVSIAKKAEEKEKARTIDVK